MGVCAQEEEHARVRSRERERERDTAQTEREVAAKKRCIVPRCQASRRREARRGAQADRAARGRPRVELCAAPDEGGHRAPARRARRRCGGLVGLVVDFGRARRALRDLPRRPARGEGDGHTRRAAVLLYAHVQDAAEGDRGDTLYKGKLSRAFATCTTGRRRSASGWRRRSRTTTAWSPDRDHCQQLARGDTVEGVLSELLGKYPGCAKGARVDAHVQGRRQLRRRDRRRAEPDRHRPRARTSTRATAASRSRCTATAANQGQLFEAMNIAALLKPLMIYVCENNQYGMGTPKGRSSANPTTTRAATTSPGSRSTG